jgi:hypothetical protein
LPLPRVPKGTELLERDRVDRGAEESGQDLATQEPGALQGWAREVGRAWLEPAVGDQERVGREAAELGADPEAQAPDLADPVAAERGLDLEVEALDLADPGEVERELADRVAADLVAQAAVRRELARGPELAVTAARHLFPV